jgi:hypothetical protein
MLGKYTYAAAKATTTRLTICMVFIECGPRE